MPQTLEELCQRYRTQGDDDARDEVLTRGARLIHFVLGRMSILLPPGIERDDLVSAGGLGLIDAVDRFDPAHNARFETYAVYRIRGSILDFLRSSDTVSRTVKAKAREVKAAWQELADSLGRPPMDAEVAAHLGVPIEELALLVEQLNAARTLSLDGPPEEDTEKEGQCRQLLDTLRDPSEPSRAVEAEETKAALKQALEKLNAQEKQVTALYYYEGLTLKEIACVMKLSESRICQLHGRAIGLLRTALTGGTLSNYQF